MRTLLCVPNILHGVTLLGLVHAELPATDIGCSVQTFLQFEKGKGTASLVQSNKGQDSQNWICIWSSFPTDHSWVYMPFYATIVQGFSAYHDAGSLVIDQRSFNTSDQLAEMSAMVEQLGLQKGDMFIWIGNVGLEQSPWTAMYNKGVHTVYVQTEPSGLCLPVPDVMVREIWDYSFKNVNKCKNEGKGQDPWPTVRYVPSGFLQGWKQANHSRDRPAPTFFGCALLRPCFDAVQASFGNQITVNNEIWNQSQFETFIDTPTIFIDIPKYCEPQSPVATSRLTLLLSAGAHIISANCYPDDQKNFEGLITFVPQDQLFNAYENAASVAPQERIDQAAGRVKLFEQGFAPTVLFEKAGIYDLLDNLTAQA